MSCANEPRREDKQDLNKQPDFSLCHATARVPTGWRRAHDAWLSSAVIPERIESILCVDHEICDIGALNGPLFSAGRFQLAFNPTKSGCVAPWNFAAKMSTGKVLIMVQDDWFPCPNWDMELRNIIPHMDGEYVVEPSVGGEADKRGLMSCGILTRKRYERFGYFLHPDYLSLYGDDEFTAVARRDGVVVDAKYLMMPHAHFSEGGPIAYDDVYKRENDPLKSIYGRQVFERRKAAGFPA